MRSILLSLPFLALALPAVADVRATVTDDVLPAYAALSDAAVALQKGAEADCSIAAMQPLWNTAFDAWMGVSFLRLGPVEEQGRALAFAFWPDAKATGRRQLSALIKAQDPQFTDATALGKASIGVRGFFGLEHLLYGPLASDEAYTCKLRAAMASDLAQMAIDTEVGWQNGFADELLTPSAEGHSLYLTESEARQALYTQLVTGLEFDKDIRLGRPLGSFDHPRPERAEMLASGRSLRNVILSLEALKGFADKLAQGMGETPKTDAAFARAIELAQELDDPVFAGVDDPMTRLKVEIVQQQIGLTVDAMQAELGPLLGVNVGFNAADGD
ncbi:imelysin family protein [Thioclava litoralis]|uniref:Imelysin family protein n=1 Tax=Thioclava litoralis TaxID=3076557 RepID=A0ABZ1E1U2_9RHOB|nr:imelysin family protein [Thioclava sp. FTW29]